MKQDPLKEKSILFAIEVAKLFNQLEKETAGSIFGKQLLRSAANPGAMLREAKYAESTADFIHKLKIARKEIYEAQYWLELLVHINLIKEEVFTPLFQLATEISKMLSSSILTAQQRTPKK